MQVKSRSYYIGTGAGKVFPGTGSAAPGGLYFVLLLLWRLPDPWWLISIFSFLPIIPVIQTVVALHDAVAGSRDRNTRFSGLNIVGLVFGAIWVLLVLIGLFMP